MSLDQEVEQAEAAAALVEERRQQEEKAAKLQSLRRQQLELEKRQNAHAAMGNILRELSKQFDSLTSDIAEFQQQFLALKDQLEALQASHAALSARRAAIRGELNRAASAWKNAHSQQIEVAGRFEWSNPIHPQADELALRLKRLSLFPDGHIEYPGHRGFDTLAGVVAGEIRSPLSWRSR